MLAALTFWPTLIVALIDSGQLDRADDLVDVLADAAKARRLDFEARLAAMRARLAVAHGRPEEAADHFEESLHLFDEDDPWLDRALTHHAYGQLLRAKGDRRQAVSAITQAHEMLSSVGAGPFVARVDADLARSGHPRRRASPSLHTGAHRPRARRSGPGGPGADKSRGRRAALHQPQSGGVPPAQHLRETRYHVTAGAALHPAVNRSAPSK